MNTHQTLFEEAPEVIEVKPERILRIKAVTEKTGLGKSTIFRLINAGQFPQRLDLGLSCIGWRESDIDQWIENLKPIQEGEQTA